MGLNATEKILTEHMLEGMLEPGSEIGIRIDQTLTQDATGTMAYLQFESMGLDRIRSELAVSYVDHNTIQIGPENADDHAYLQTVAARYGAVFSKPGNGICHQLHRERFGVPGKTLLGSDSHTPTGGGLGMFAVGAGGIDVAVAMGGGPFYLTAPKVVNIVLKGRMGPWVSAKDVMLRVLEIFSTQGNVGCVFEYGGPALKHLTVPERSTITNMGAECGVTTSVFPSDEVTRRFLEAQGRGEAWRELSADPDAEYERRVEIDLSKLEPLAAAPHSPGNVVSVNSIAGLKVNQVLIGSCTNSSYRDLKTVARLLKGQHVHPDVSLGIAPGSRQVLEMMAKEGLLTDMIAAGARLLESACGFCIGNSLSPSSEGVSLRTSNRNFEGRSGTQSGRVYLVSPETAVLAAVHGRVIDGGLQTELTPPRVRAPQHFLIDDNMFVDPPEDGSQVEIVKGPNIGEVPVGEPLVETLNGVVAIRVGDKITTDHIMPAGPRLKYRSNVPKYSTFVFEHVDPEFSERAAGHRDRGLHNVIVAGESYGQGSSREHAALCPMYLGVRAVIAQSIERIHLANLINFGIVPLFMEDTAAYEQLTEGTTVRIPGLREAVAGEGRVVALCGDCGAEVALRAELSERQKQILLAGGLLNFCAEQK